MENGDKNMDGAKNLLLSHEDTALASVQPVGYDGLPSISAQEWLSRYCRHRTIQSVLLAATLLPSK